MQSAASSLEALLRPSRAGRGCERQPEDGCISVCRLMLSCQRLRTSSENEQMYATLRPATRKHPPNAGPDVHPWDCTCYGGALEGLGWLSSLEGEAFPQAPDQTCSRQLGTDGTQFQTRRPTSPVPTCCLLWYGSTSHQGTVAKRTRAVLRVTGFGDSLPSCVR